MTRPPLLIVGSIHAAILERVETARLLGFEPIGVQLEGNTGHASLTCYLANLIPEEIKGSPCVAGGVAFYKDLENARRDRRWLEANKRLVQEAENAGFTNWVTLIHPSAEVSPSSTLGKGVFVGPLVSISSEAILGDFVSLSRNSSVGHHVAIGDYCAIGPGVIIPGGVTLGASVLVGPAATFLNGIRVSDGSLIGAGSVVTRHVRNGNQVMGNPARKLRRPIARLRRFGKNLARRVLRRTGLYSMAKNRYRRIFR